MHQPTLSPPNVVERTLGNGLTILVEPLPFVRSVSLGFLIAWRMNSSQAYHAIMSVFLFPMWLLSGAIFPISDLHPVFKFFVHLNPMTYGVSALRHTAGLPGATPSLPVCLLVTAGFAALMLFLAARAAARPAKGDLR